MLKKRINYPAIVLLTAVAMTGCGNGNKKEREAANPLATLSDEFDDSATWANWTKAADVKFDREYLGKYDINGTSPGNLYIEAIKGTWYGANTGHLSYKRVVGDFVATMRVKVTGKDTPIPQRSYDLTGLMARVPNVKEGDSYPDTNENWEYITTGGVSKTRIIDYKKNIKSGYSFKSADVHTDWIELRLARVGNQIVKLYREDGGQWQFAEASNREDFPSELQVGFCLLTDLYGAPDNYTTIDYICFDVPHPSDKIEGKITEKKAEPGDWIELLGSD